MAGGGPTDQLQYHKACWIRVSAVLTWLHGAGHKQLRRIKRGPLNLQNFLNQNCRDWSWVFFCKGPSSLCFSVFLNISGHIAGATIVQHYQCTQYSSITEVPSTVALLSSIITFLRQLLCSRCCEGQSQDCSSSSCSGNKATQQQTNITIKHLISIGA